MRLHMPRQIFQLFFSICAISIDLRPSSLLFHTFPLLLLQHFSLSGIFASKVVATRPAPRNSLGSGNKLRKRPPRITPFTSRGTAGTSSFGEAPARSSPTAASAGPSSRISKLGGATDAQPAGSSSNHLIRMRTVVLPSVRVGGGSVSASQVPEPSLIRRGGGSIDFSPNVSKHSSDLSTRGTGSSGHQNHPPPSSGTTVSATVAAPASQPISGSASGGRSVSGGLPKSPSFVSGSNLMATCMSVGSSSGLNHGSVGGGAAGVILTTMMSTLNDSIGGDFHSSAHAVVPTWDDDTHMLILKVGGTGLLTYIFLRGGKRHDEDLSQREGCNQRLRNEKLVPESWLHPSPLI